MHPSWRASIPWGLVSCPLPTPPVAPWHSPQPEITCLFGTYKALKKQLKRLPDRTQVSAAQDDQQLQTALTEEEEHFVATLDRNLAKLVRACLLYRYGCTDASIQDGDVCVCGGGSLRTTSRYR